MLGRYYSFTVLSDLDQTLTYDNAARISISYTEWKMESGVYSDNLVTDDFGFVTGSTLADTEQIGTTHVDNTSNNFMGIVGDFKVTADANSTDGNMYLYLQKSTDNTFWPSGKADFDITTDMTLVCVLPLTTDAEDETRGTNFEIPA